MNKDIQTYNNIQTGENKSICQSLGKIINENLPNSENKIWHGHPVWFLEGNPIVGYAKLKDSVQLLFWSGQSFDEPNLVSEGTFKAAQFRYISIDQINEKDLIRWLEKSQKIQWDYKNIVKRRGKLEKILK